MALRLEPVVEQEYWGYWVKATAWDTPSLPRKDKQMKQGACYRHSHSTGNGHEKKVLHSGHS